MLFLVSCIRPYGGMSFDSCSLAHQAAIAVGILHRDLSPSNIIIVGGRGYLIDWDFAKYTKTASRRRITRAVCHSFFSCLLSDEWTGHLAIHVCQPR